MHYESSTVYMALREPFWWKEPELPENNEQTVKGEFLHGNGWELG